MQKQQYRLSIKCRVRCDKGHIGLRKSAYYHAKCTISGHEMGSFGVRNGLFWKTENILLRHGTGGIFIYY